MCFSCEQKKSELCASEHEQYPDGSSMIRSVPAPQIFQFAVDDNLYYTTLICNVHYL
jgi:hypothetical protein